MFAYTGATLISKKACIPLLFPAYEPCHEKTGFFAYAKAKTQISCAVTAQLISVFVFATQIVQSLFFLNTNFKPLAIFCDCTARFVSDLVGNPEDPFSHDAALVQGVQHRMDLVVNFFVLLKLFLLLCFCYI